MKSLHHTPRLLLLILSVLLATQTACMHERQQLGFSSHGKSKSSTSKEGRVFYIDTKEDINKLGSDIDVHQLRMNILKNSSLSHKQIKSLIAYLGVPHRDAVKEAKRKVGKSSLRDVISAIHGNKNLSFERKSELLTLFLSSQSWKKQLESLTQLDDVQKFELITWLAATYRYEYKYLNECLRVLVDERVIEASDAIDDKGNTLLHHLVGYLNFDDPRGQDKLADFLRVYVDKKCLYQANDDNRTPWEEALAMGNLSAAQVLIKAMRGRDVREKEIDTPQGVQPDTQLARVQAYLAKKHEDASEKHAIRQVFIAIGLSELHTPAFYMPTNKADARKTLRVTTIKKHKRQLLQEDLSETKPLEKEEFSLRIKHNLSQGTLQ